MKATCHILVFQDRVSSNCFEALAAVFPQGKRGISFELKLPPDHPAIPKVIQVLQAHGLKMRPNASVPARKEFIDITYYREFEDSDLASAAFLETRAEQAVGYGFDRTENGQLRITTEYLTKRFRVASVGDSVVATEPVRASMEKQRLEHLAFRRCQVVGDGSEDYEDFPIWELTSDLVLPPLSPNCKLCDCSGGTDYTNPEKGCSVDDGLFLPTQYRYRASDLSAVGAFDAAHTREAMGFQLKSHPLIVSQRFYQYCQQQKFKLWWYPVIIDED